MIRTCDVRAIQGTTYGFLDLLEELFGRPNPLLSAIDRGEAPDYYTSVTVRHWGSGTRVRDFGSNVVTETISYDQTMTFNRISLNSSVTHRDTDHRDRGTVDRFDTNAPGSGETHIGLAGPGKGWDIARHYLVFDFHELIGPVSIGTREVNYDDPGTDDTSESIMISFYCPPWVWKTNPTPPTNLRDRWNVVEIYVGGAGVPVEFDASAITDWRDLRGTYAVSVDDSDIDGSWDSNDVVHHTSFAVS